MIKLKNTRTCLYCRACTGMSCMLGFKTDYYEPEERKWELSKWDTEQISIHPVEKCPKPLTRAKFVQAMEEFRCLKTGEKEEIQNN